MAPSGPQSGRAALGPKHGHHQDQISPGAQSPGHKSNEVVFSISALLEEGGDAAIADKEAWTPSQRPGAVRGQG